MWHKKVQFQEPVFLESARAICDAIEAIKMKIHICTENGYPRQLVWPERKHGLSCLVANP